MDCSKLISASLTHEGGLLPKYLVGTTYLVESRRGGYELKITNQSAARIELLAFVDGVDLLNGNLPPSLANQGVYLAPFASYSFSLDFGIPEVPLNARVPTCKGVGCIRIIAFEVSGSGNSPFRASDFPACILQYAYAPPGEIQVYRDRAKRRSVAFVR